MFKHVKSLALRVWYIWCSKYLKEKDDQLTDLINQSINDSGVCRTAPATPGLLKITTFALHMLL